MWICDRGDHSDWRVCFVGDSFGQGVGDTTGLGWVGRVAAGAHAWDAGLTAYNLGVRRDTSADIAIRWQAECEARLPAEGVEAGVVFSFDANDTTVEDGRRRVPEEQSLEYLEQILTI